MGEVDVEVAQQDQGAENEPFEPFPVVLFYEIRHADWVSEGVLTRGSG